MDATDWKILSALQHEGRLSITELADRVRLSLSPCHRRLRSLERDGVIAGYRAVVDPKAIGLDFEALVFVTMSNVNQNVIRQFEADLADIPAIVHAQRLFGDPDYLLRILTTDLTAYQQLYDDCLSSLPGVQRLTSTLVMKSIVDSRPLTAQR